MFLTNRSLSLVAASLLAFAISSPAQNSTTPIADNGSVVDFDPGSSDVKPLFKVHASHSHAIGGHTSHGIPAIDSLVNFSGQFHADGYDPNGNPQSKWLYNMIGQMPQHGGTTVINAPIVPVNVVLLNQDGSVYASLNGATHVNDVLNSPVFQKATYSSSGTPTQFTDAVQRAEFYKSAKADWHTLLAPSVKTTRTMTVPYGYYRTYVYRSTGQFAFFAIDYDTFGNLLFPSTPTDTTTPIGAAENAHEITTQDLSTFLFPSVYLYQGNQCCVLGYHSYDYEPGDSTKNSLEKRYVVDYAAWIDPGPFGAAFADVTALSHEIAEAYNDPFVASDGVHNITPWWLAPNGLCQNNLETGDVIEGLGNATYPMQLTSGGMVYHPQNEALLQWFEFLGSSDALDNAYSYPNVNVLTNLSAPQKAGCQ